MSSNHVTSIEGVFDTRDCCRVVDAVKVVAIEKEGSLGPSGGKSVRDGFKKYVGTVIESESNIFGQFAGRVDGGQGCPLFRDSFRGHYNGGGEETEKT
jgi:hypothetical protein